MEKIILPVIAGLLLFGLVRLLLLPMRLVWKLLINGISGVLLLWVVNLTAGFTGFSIPVNLVTAIISGTLGLPGIILLAILQLFF